MNKTAIIFGASLLALSTQVFAAPGDKANTNEIKVTEKGSATFEDPEKGGIGYEWHIKMPHHGAVEIVGSVGGKSSFEPNFRAPNFGWTHTSDWVALELDADAVLEIVVRRQAGVYDAKPPKKDATSTKLSYVTAGASLYPAVSIYSGWDSTTEKEKGSFNPIGNFWSTIQFMDVEYSKEGESMIVYRKYLGAGKYSIDIGGVNALYCTETDACFKGLHGYRATFTTSHIKHVM